MSVRLSEAVLLATSGMKTAARLTSDAFALDLCHTLKSLTYILSFFDSLVNKENEKRALFLKTENGYGLKI